MIEIAAPLPMDSPDDIMVPARRVVYTASQVVTAALRALEGENSHLFGMENDKSIYPFERPYKNHQKCRIIYENWIISKGFQDLARGVRETLETALIYTEKRNFGGDCANAIEFRDRIEMMQEKVGNLSFPELVKKLSKRLAEPIPFERSFSWLQRVRNCFEHRGGIVGRRDLDQDSEQMTLTFPYHRSKIKIRDKEINVNAEGRLDADEEDRRLGPGETMTLNFELGTEVRKYTVNEKIVISADDFHEISMSCMLLARYLVGKIPK